MVVQLIRFRHLINIEDKISNQSILLQIGSILTWRGYLVKHRKYDIKVAHFVADFHDVLLQAFGIKPALMITILLFTSYYPTSSHKILLNNIFCITIYLSKKISAFVYFCNALGLYLLDERKKGSWGWSKSRKSSVLVWLDLRTSRFFA